MCHPPLPAYAQVNGVVKDLLERWNHVKANHSVTVVLFSRTYFDETQTLLSHAASEQLAVMEDAMGRKYQDHYVVCMCVQRFVPCVPVLSCYALFIS